METYRETRRRSLLAIILIFAILTLGVSAAGYVFYNNQAKHYQIGIENQLSSITNVKARVIEQWWQERLGDALIFYRNVTFSEAVQRYFKKPGDLESIKEVRVWLETVQTQHRYKDILLIDNKGVDHLSVSVDLPQVSDFLKGRALQVMKTGEVESTDFYRNINDNSIYLACLVPIVDPDDSRRFIATLVFLIDPQQFVFPFIKYWPTESKSAETIIVRRDSDEVVYLNDLKFRKNAPLERRIPITSLESPAVKAVLGQEGIVQGMGYNGERVIADVCQITGTPWYLESCIDKSEVYAPLRQQFWLMIVIVGSLIGGAGAFVGWLWNRQNASFYRQRYEASNTLKEITLLNESRLQSLYEISQYKFEDEQDLLSFTLEQAIKLTGSKIGHLRQYDETIQVFNLITYSKEVAKECKVTDHKPVRKLDETGLWAEAVRQRKSVVVNDFKAPNSFKKGQPDGHVELVRYVATPIFYADKIVAVVGVANKESDYNDTDIMQLSLLMEAAWRIIESNAATEQQKKLITAVEQSADCIVITDVSGTIIYANPAVEKISGYNIQELIGQNPKILKSGVHDQSFYKEIWDTITAGETWSGRFVNRRKDGTRYFEEATISPVLNAVGKITNFVAVKHDATKRRELQAQLFQAQKMEAIGTLAGGFAHDFNNLLQVIMGYLELTLSTKDLPDNLKTNLEETQRAAKSGADLVKRMLVFGRKSPVKLEPVNINNIVEQVHPLLDRSMPQLIEMELLMDNDLWAINGDLGQMEQILMNLAINARDAMPNGGKLTIETQNIVLEEEFCIAHLGLKRGRYALLSVTDTGTGMDEETAKHIFEPFFTTKEAGKGTGLGLSVVYGIVEQHGGKIICDSQLSVGTTFNVYFPAIE